MCGISSIFRYTELTESDKEKLHSMNQEMHYRGPDDRGFWYDKKCGMAQVRLSIIGLEKGKQPMFNEDNSLVLICNGEIYNYVELKRNLLNKGHIFNSESDSETILHLYEEYGVKCLDYLRGMFAFCLWDISKKQFFAARDRIGEKTLYFSELPTGVVFSTELKALLKFYIPNPQINLEELAAPLRYTAPIIKGQTFIEQIKRIEPGQFILVDDDGLTKHFYWKRDVRPVFKGIFDEAKKKTLSLMRESVDLCLQSDVPVAVMLSGGIDSSAIATFAKESGREVHTITAGYKGRHDVDERNIAKKFAKESGFNYHEIELDKNDFKNCFEELSFHLDEPITDAGAIAQWALYKKVKSLGFKVLLGGIGGDELFYGYPYWNSIAESLTIHNQHLSLFPWKGFEKKVEFLKFFFKNFKYISFNGYPYKVADSSVCFWHYQDYYDFEKDAFFKWGDKILKFNDVRLQKVFGECIQGNELDLVYKFSFDNIMTMAYLYLSDRLGMGNSLEIRSPMLDYKLVEFVSGLPIQMKYKKDQPKYFLKEILKGIVPDYILFGPKKGFSPPTNFINEIVSNYNYKIFSAEHKYYNSIISDSILFNLKK